METKGVVDGDVSDGVMIMMVTDYIRGSEHRQHAENGDSSEITHDNVKYGDDYEDE